MSAHLKQLVEAWDPSGDADLPDEVALALDSDPEFRAWFDARFAAAPKAEDAVPDGLAGRVMPKEPEAAPKPANRRRWVLGAIGLGVTGLAAASVGFVVLGAGGGMGVMLMGSAPVDLDGTYDGSQSSARDSGLTAGHEPLPKGAQIRMRKDEIDRLRELGYPQPENTHPDADSLGLPVAADGGDVGRWLSDLGYADGGGEPTKAIPRATTIVELDPHHVEYTESNAPDASRPHTGEHTVTIIQGSTSTTRPVGDPPPSEAMSADPAIRMSRIDHKGVTLYDDDQIVEMVKAVVGQQLPKLRYQCYEPALEAGTSFSGTWTLGFTVGTTGDVTEATAVGRDVKGIATAPRAPAFVNGFVTTAEDAQSTFSIDVDAASYTQARKALRDGGLPPRDEVRVEEFVNYFPYDYAPPIDGEPFAVHAEAAPSPWGGTELVRIGVQGRKIAADDRAPAHLVFLVDTSGSMASSDKLPLVQQSLKMLVNELKDGDTVALVVYAGSAGVVLEPTAMSDKATILRAIDQLSAGGSTAMGAGIAAAYQLAADGYEPGATNRVIIASDGDANVGTVDTGSLSTFIEGYADKGITLTTLGFGSGNYRDSRMEQLADDGDGNYFYIDGEAEARRVFVDRLTGTMQVIAKDVKLQVDWNPAAVESYRLIGYENRDIADRDFANDRVDAGEIGAGHQVTALYEVTLAARPTGSWATMHVRSKAPGRDSPSVEREYPITADIAKPSLVETTRDFRIALGSAELAERLRGSPYGADYGYEQVAELVAGARRAEYPQDDELAELVGLAGRLDAAPPADDAADVADFERCLTSKVRTWQFQPIASAVPVSKSVAFNPRYDAATRPPPLGVATIRVPAAQPFTSVEVKCSAVRARANFVDGVARVPDVPTNEDCTVFFKGGVPAQFKPVRGGMLLDCVVVGGTTRCRAPE
jgi:Ca-activated chloride channel family protein